MSATQILFYILIIVLLSFSVRRFLLFRLVQQYSPAKVAEKLSSGNGVVLLDVRTAAERGDHFIQGSVRIPLQELRGRLRELEKYREREIICYCRSGNRSLSAAAMLRRHGFQSANLQGGIVEWNFSGR